MEKNATEALVIPEIPKVTPKQAIETYIPIAFYDVPGIAKYDSMSFIIKDGTVALRRNFLRTIIDFTIDVATGVGKIYYDDGTVSTVSFPISEGKQTTLKGIKEVFFRADGTGNFSWVYNDGEYLLTVGFEDVSFDTCIVVAEQYYPDGTYEFQPFSNIIKSADGKLLLQSSEPYTGRLLIYDGKATYENLAPSTGSYSLAQVTGVGGSHGSSNTEYKGASAATGRNAVAFGVLGLSAGDCTFTSGYGAKAYEKGCVAFGTGVAGRTSQEWIAYYWDVENWTNAHYNNSGGVQLVEGDLPEDWQNKGIVQKPGTTEYYYVVAKSGSTWVKYGGFFLNPAYAEGQGTKAKGTWSHAQGYLTEALADFSDASGQQTKSHAHHGHVGGHNSNNYSPYGFVHGFYCETSPDIEGQVVFGKYNTKNSDAMLQVGNGTGPGVIARKTIFEVLKDGRVKVYGKPQDNNDVVRLKDLNDAIESCLARIRNEI